MSQVSALSAIEARIAGIVTRMNVRGAAQRPTLGASTELSGPSDPTVGFDPFGAVYQEALNAIPAAGGDYGQGTAMQAGPLGAFGTSAVARATPTIDVGAPAGPGGRLSAEQVARLAHGAGFRGQDLTSMVAIAMRESGGNPNALNPNAGTGDMSYGLWQINMIGALGPDRAQKMGLSSYDQLFDPATNARAAYQLYQESGSTLRPWGGYKGMENTYGTDMAAAEAAVRNAGLLGTTGAVRVTDPNAVAAVPTVGAATPSASYTPVIDPATGVAVPGASVGKIGGFGPMPIPAEVAGYGNGRIPTDALLPIGQGSHRLYAPAAEAWKGAVAAAAAEGIELRITDSYRSYDEQVDLVRRKGLYSQGGLAATPGTSQHGWGLAVDADVTDPATLNWVRANAHRFGWVEAVPREPWHWEYRPNQA